MDKRDIKTCYLCGKTEFSNRPGRVRDNDQLHVLECCSCGLVFLSSFAHVQDEFYQNSIMHEDDKAFLDIDYWLKELDWDDERRFNFLKPLIQNKTLLDFGCGVAGFLLKAGEIARKVVGVEVEKRLQSHFKQIELQVFQNLSELEARMKDEKYDLITLFSVLEHLPDPRTVLGELSPFLENDGQIIIEVPNANDALLTLYNCKPYSQFNYWSCHLFLFTAETLRDLAEQAGFSVNYVKQIQRYPLSNHLFWLAKGKPRGHEIWSFLDSEMLREVYEKQLAATGHCDTLVMSLSRKHN
jgi:2-polyprenyl-3-methyl-5-hydroxy-6-metoxy-1,4-benzoquinol methylase